MRILIQTDDGHTIVNLSEDQIHDHVMATFPEHEEEWYADINLMTADAFKDVIHSLVSHSQTRTN